MLVLYPHFSPSHESRNPYSKMGTCFSSQSFWDRPGRASTASPAGLSKKL